ncbi:MAG: hypothetical protein JWN76_1949 [Chitinophagaceae bacterium]|nr:hypothetical protein [Chitinophagaceae bacterium]
MPLKKLIRRIHLWLGLISGPVIFIVSITGCMYVFQQEIFESTHKNVLFVKPGKAYLPLSSLWARAQTIIGDDLHISSAGVYNDPLKSWSFTAIETNSKGPTYFSYYKNFKTVYLDPYTGLHTGTINYKYEFFTITKWIHQSLLLNYKTGHLIVGWSTVGFVVMLITGLILWWPKNRYTIKQRFIIKRNTRWRRFNYDLHYVPGFYALVFSLVIAVTG